MKIGDVEYQGDCNKAIFYYIADGRVDFRQLIKVLAETFHVRIEMKQIGARQEAGRIGGTGPCGRELCCATWMKNFVSVSTNSARFQDISLNPQKLAGMCAKLKCCLNYEVDSYVEAGRKLPSKEVILQTKDADYHLFKTDILAGLVTYSTDKRLAANLVTLTAERAFEIINLNKQGEKPERLDTGNNAAPSRPADLVEQESLTRFDKRKKNKNKRKDNRNGKGNNGGNNNNTGNENREQKPAAKDNPTERKENTGRERRGNDRNRNRDNRDNGNNRPPQNRNRQKKGKSPSPKNNPAPQPAESAPAGKTE